MFWWSVMGACGLWLAAGPEGMRTALPIGGLAVLAIAIVRLLNSVSSGKKRGKRSQEMRIWKPRQVELSAFARRRWVQS